MQNISRPSVKISSFVPLATKLPKSDTKAPCRRESAARSPGHSWRRLHQQFVEYGRNAREWTRKCILLLPEIENQQIWRKKRFHSIYDYAAKLAGMSRNQVNEALRILERTENLPALRKIIEERGVNAVKPVIAIATSLTDSFWAEKANKMSQHPLEAYVKEFRKLQSVNGLRAEASQSVDLQTLPFESSRVSQSVNLQSLALDSLSTVFSPSLFQSAGMQTGQQSLPLAPSPQSSASVLHSLARISSVEFSAKVTIAMQLDPEVSDRIQKLKGQGDWNDLLKKFVSTYDENLEKSKPAIVEVKPKGSSSGSASIEKSKIYSSRAIPAAIEKYVLAKTNSTCAFPGCSKPYEILHHLDRFAMYHIHDPDRIVPLCKAHENLAHLGLIENENRPPQYWKIRTNPDLDDPKYEIDRIVERFRQPSG